MALNGYVTADQRRSRLVKTSCGFVVAYRRGPQDYDIYRDGNVIGRVTKFKHWYADTGKKTADRRSNGAFWPKLTRQDAIEWLVKKTLGVKDEEDGVDEA